MKVSNIQGPHGPVKNQFHITDDNGTRYFQSYDSIIARIKDGKVTLDAHYWDYSTTTGKYRNIFLGETKAETLKKITSGVYTIENLNPS